MSKRYFASSFYIIAFKLFLTQCFDCVKANVIGSDFNRYALTFIIYTLCLNKPSSANVYFQFFCDATRASFATN